MANRDTQDVPILVPKVPDGGYGWVITFIGFMGNVLVSGVNYSFYLVQESLMKSLKVEEMNASIVGSLYITFNFLAGKFL
jgi:hypothetical protein